MTCMLSAYQYKVVPLYECMQHSATRSWMEQAGLPLPDRVPPGRYPTPLEIRAVMESLPGVQTSYVVGKAAWQVTLRYRNDVGWATLAVDKYSGNLEDPHAIYFVGGWDELIQQSAAALAKGCGPLVLLHESGAPPQIVW